MRNGYVMNERRLKSSKPGRGPSWPTPSGSLALANGPVIIIDLDDREVLGPQLALDLHPLAHAVLRRFALVPCGPDPVDQPKILIPGHDRGPGADLRPVCGIDVQDRP